MRKMILSAVSVCLVLPAFAGNAPETDDEKALYYLGVALSRNVKQFNLTPEEAEFVVSGLSDALGGGETAVDESYGPKLNEFLEKRREAEREEEKKKGEKFAAQFAGKNKKAEKTKSGLLFLLTKKGKGERPDAGDKVKVHYKGYFTDGEVFDSSYDRKKPAEFPLKAVIPCWTEGLQMMKTGSKATLVCPSDIAYGDFGRPGAIPGGATLVFDIELLEIIKKDEAQ